MLLGSGQKVRTKLSAGGIELDDKLKEVTLDGEPVNLTRTEYDILKLLMEHPGKYIHRNRFMRPCGRAARAARRKHGSRTYPAPSGKNSNIILRSHAI